MSEVAENDDEAAAMESDEFQVLGASRSRLRFLRDGKII